MRFIHFADCHLDGFREPKLAKLGFENFTYVIDFALEKNVDFVLLAGDLFNTAIPRVDALKITVSQLKKLQDKSIPVYAIPGSHDYSPHGKTMLDVLELAGLLINVMKGDVNEKGSLELEYTKDPKTGTLITGILGKKGMLDKKYYEQLDTSHLLGNGFKIFLFHTAITELKTKKLEEMDSASINTLPEGFNYYAGGHVHVAERFSNEKYKHAIYPGPTFPNSFSELEDLKKGSFVYYDSKEIFPEGNNSHFTHIKIPNKEVLTKTFNANNKTSHELEEEVKEFIESTNCIDKIVLFRFIGQLSNGKSQDINFKELMKLCYDKGAYIVLKNTYKLTSKEFEEVMVDQETSELVEDATIKEHLGQIELSKEFDEETIIKSLLDKLNCEMQDGEKKTMFVERVVELTKDILEPK